MKTHVEFYDGTKMPIVGLGTWQTNDQEVLDKVLDKALEVGYRHFDTAFAYGNEEALGKVFNRWISSGKVKRQDLFISTKLPIQGHHKDRVEHFLKLSLKRLQLDYIDLYLVHNPACVQVAENGLDAGLDSDGKALLDTSCTMEDAWRAMEAQVAAGRVKSIGMSSFSVAQVERIMKIAKVKPANLQVELNVYYPEKKLRAVCRKYDITVTAFAPLGSPGRKESYVNEKGSHLKANIPELLKETKVVTIANKYKKSPAQILLKFLTQQGITVIPKSVTPSRIGENFDIFGFELDADSLKELDTLDTGKPGTWAFDWCDYLPGLDNHPEFQLELE